MIRIGGHSFVDLEQAKHFVRQLLSKYVMGSRVSDPDDIDFLTQLIRRHPEFDAKFSSGIRAYKVVRNPAQKATELEIQRDDGGIVCTPWVVCLL